MGILYVVATPIGNLADFSARAIEILKTVDWIAAEDTRHTKKLLSHFGIATPMLALHEHNERQQTDHLMTKLAEQNIALVSDAGTPLISDPGSFLIQMTHEAGYSVVPVPGCCAAIAALSVAGLPPRSFCFEGFLPTKKNARQEALAKLQNETRHLIFYEAPHRVLETLRMMQQQFGETRQAILAREITKKFETIKKDTLKGLYDWVYQDKNQQKGEFVIVVEGINLTQQVVIVTDEAAEVLQTLCQSMPAKKACELLASLTLYKKNQLYNFLLQANKDESL